jgi:hypothetical protein
MVDICSREPRNAEEVSRLSMPIQPTILLTQTPKESPGFATSIAIPIILPERSDWRRNDNENDMIDGLLKEWTTVLKD